MLALLVPGLLMGGGGESYGHTLAITSYYSAGVLIPEQFEGGEKVGTDDGGGIA
jgi:hypothetical protein